MTTQRFFQGMPARRPPGKSTSCRRRNSAPTASSRSGAFFVELAGDQFGDRVERGLGLGAGRGDDDGGPGPADSIISPMIEVPPTVSPPRVTQTSALKRSTIWTNFAEARA